MGTAGEGSFMIGKSGFGLGCRSTRGARWALSLLLLSLGACGGSDRATEDTTRTGLGLSQSASSEVDAMTRSASLNARELESLAQVSASEGVVAVRKAQSLSTSPIFRFYNTISGAHFFTASEPERDRMLLDDGAAHFEYEGPAFSAILPSDVSAGLDPVHRFYNSRNGVHFYTISEDERSYIQSNPVLRHYVYEGIAYLASKVEGGQFEPLYRFYVPKKGFHFYTASADERDQIQRNLAGTYVYEGVGYYVLKPQQGTVNPALPHTKSVSRAARLILRGMQQFWCAGFESTTGWAPINGQSDALRTCQRQTGNRMCP